MNERKKQQLLQAILRAVDESLKRNSFTSHGLRDEVLDANIQRWIRDSRWKREGVEAVYPKRYCDHIILNVEVELPISPYETVTLDGTTVGYLAGHEVGSYDFPTFAFRSLGFVRSLVYDLEMALRWFEMFKTPQSSLGRLNTGETMIGPPKTCGAYQKALKYLERLK